jgi:RNA polymerase sigma factor (sigma-70 family)
MRPPFAALLDRHGPRLFGVCRRLLGHEQDAEDVFQATFLLLARRAGTVRKRASVGSWLYGVAYRLALKQRAATARGRLHARGGPEPTVPDPTADVSWGELRAALDEELGRLPERYRAPLLLCYFEGLTQDEAARQLGWKARTVKARLARGRDLLRHRLTRRGLTLSAALTGSLLAPAVSSAAVPVALAEATARAARLFAGGECGAGTVSAQVAALAAGGLRAMFLNRLQFAVAIALGAALAAGGAGPLLSRAGPQAPTAANQAAPMAKAPAPAAPPHAATDRWGDPLPAGAITRLGTVRFRVGEFAQGVAFLAGGKTLVTAEDTFQLIQFWDADTGRLRREFSAGPLGIQAFALSPDGKRIAVSGLPIYPDKPHPRGIIRVLDTASGKKVRSFPRTLDNIQMCPVAFSPDGKVLASLTCPCGILRLEDIATGVELLQHKFRGNNLGDLAMSRDGKTLAVVSLKLYVWKWQGRQAPRELKAPNFRPGWSALSPDGKLLACTNDQGGPVHVWDVATGGIRFLLDVPGKDYRHSVPIFSPDGKMLAVSGYSGRGVVADSAVHLWDAATGRHLRRLDALGSRLAFSPDSRRLAVASVTVRVWDLASGKELAGNDEAHRNQVDYVAASAGNLVATAGGHTVRLWDRATGKQRFKLTHDAANVSVGLAPDGSKVATAGLDDTVRVWDARDAREIHRLRGHGRLGRAPVLSFTPDGQRLLSWGLADFHLRVWDVRTGKALLQHALRPAGVRLPDAKTELKDSDWENLVSGGAAFSRDGKTFVLPISRVAQVFDVPTGGEVRTLSLKMRCPDGVVVSPDGKRLLAAGWGDDIRSKGADGQEQSSSAETHPLALWDLTTGKRLRQVFLPGGTNGPVAFSPDGKTYTEATDTPAGIRLWDAATGKERQSIRGFRGRVTALAFTPDGRQLISGMSDTTALVWAVKAKPD